MLRRIFIGCMIISVMAISISLSEERYIPDIETFMLIGGAGSPHVSPADGAIYFISSISGEPQLYRINDHGWPYRMTFFPDGISGHKMSDDGSVAVVLAAKGGNERRQLYLMDPITGQIKPLTDKPDVRFGSIVWSPDSKTIYYYSNEANNRDFYIYSMDIESGESKLIKEIKGINNAQDISRDGRYLLIEAWPKNVNNRLYLLDLVSGDLEEILRHEDDYNFMDGQFMQDGKYIWMLSNYNEKELIKISRYDIARRELEFFNMESPWESGEGEMVLSDDGKYLAWIANENGYGVLHIIDTETLTEVSSPPVSGIVSGVKFAPGNRVIFAFSSPTKTYDIWTWDWESEDLRQITFSSYAGINPDIFIEPTLIHYETFDGREIPAFLYLPTEYDGEVIPFVIHAHGGPEGQFRPGFQRHFQYLLLHGYGILAPNVRGSEGYGREYMTLDNHRKRLDSIEDYKAAADFLIENGYSRKGKLGIKGGSYGGYATMASISEHPDYWGAAYSSIGISNFKTFLLNTDEYRRAIREAEYGSLSDSIWLESISPISRVNRITAPLLLVHGGNDPRVPVSETRQIFHAIKEQGGLVDTLIFSDEGHGTAKRANAIAKYRKMVDFFDKYLKD